MKPRRQTVVLVAPNWLGDAVMSLPVLGYLAAAPGVRVAVLAAKYTARVFWNMDAADELIITETRDGRLVRMRRRIALLRRHGADAAVVLPPSFSSALVAFGGGVPNRVGFGTDGRALLLSESVFGGDQRDEHLSRNYLRLGERVLARLGIGRGHDYETPALSISPEEDAAAARLLFSVGAPPAGFVTVVPMATYGPTKSWPIEDYRRFVSMLCKDVRVVLGGTAAERGACDSIAQGLKGVYNLAGWTSLGEFIAVLSRASAIVANDSGAPHVAGALGVPSVVLFGSTSPKWTRPLGERVTVVRHPVPCGPCFRRHCPMRLECLRGISPEMVLDAVRDLVAERPGRTRHPAPEGKASP